MMDERRVVLKHGKEKAIRNRHHWIFSGAILKAPKFVDGEILQVFTEKGDLLGSAYFNQKAKIIGRMVCFDSTSPLHAIRSSLDAAIDFRLNYFRGSETNAYRLVNGEGDRLPGLIIDKYDNILVVQISTAGMEKLRTFIVGYLVEKLAPNTIYEKSVLPSRKEEGLADEQKVIFGKPVEQVVVKENGLKFSISPSEGQKTGFFLDHREMRKMIKGLSKGKRILNCFAYTGGFSVYALAGEALKVDSVDISEKAIELAKQNAVLNGFDCQENRFIAADVFHFLRENELPYDVVILDPPAFAKRQKDVIPACRGYKDINRIAMQKMPPHSLLLTCSCSYYVDESLFQKVIFQASVEAKRNVRIIGRHHLAADHPVNICHPESDYLKSLLLYIE